jgi:hypothetical protein
MSHSVEPEKVLSVKRQPAHPRFPVCVRGRDFLATLSAWFAGRNYLAPKRGTDTPPVARREASKSRRDLVAGTLSDRFGFGELLLRCARTICLRHTFGYEKFMFRVSVFCYGFVWGFWHMARHHALTAPGGNDDAGMRWVTEAYQARE